MRQVDNITANIHIIIIQQMTWEVISQYKSDSTQLILYIDPSFEVRMYPFDYSCPLRLKYIKRVKLAMRAAVTKRARKKNGHRSDLYSFTSSVLMTS